MRTAAMAGVAAALAAMTAGCGYHVSGTADAMPKSVKTIAIPAFTNLTTRPRLAQSLAGALTREFLTRTRYQIVADPDAADAVLTGVVSRYENIPVLYDQNTGRASGVQVNVRLDVTLRERASGKTLYSRTGFDYRDRYEISIDPTVYLEESDATLERLSRDVARSVVSAVLENF